VRSDEGKLGEPRRGDDAGGGIFLETLAERAALAPVEGKHGAVLRETGKRAVDHCPRNPGGGGFARHRREEGAKIASACRRACGCSERRVQNRIAVDRNGVLLLGVLLLDVPRVVGIIARGKAKTLAFFDSAE
jgi:hypothetical protein